MFGRVDRGHADVARPGLVLDAQAELDAAREPTWNRSRA